MLVIAAIIITVNPTIPNFLLEIPEVKALTPSFAGLSVAMSKPSSIQAQEFDLFYCLF